MELLYVMHISLVGRDSFVERIAFFYGILKYIVYIDLGL